MKILIEEPEYQIMRDRDANTAVSSLAITLPQAKTGARIKVKNASRFAAFPLYPFASPLPFPDDLIRFSKRNMPSPSS